MSAILFIFILSTALALDRQHPYLSASAALAKWIHRQDAISLAHVLANIAPTSDPRALPGSVCASPSRSHPDYYYMWTRDSALVMRELTHWQPSALDDYAGLTEYLQTLDTRYGLGEAKFHMDGSAFTKEWCNAQNDGPASRATTILRYAEQLGGHSWLFKKVVVRDLDYIADVWHHNSSCDIWEEARGLHFYTLMAQRTALEQGTQWASKMNDPARSKEYARVAGEISAVLPRFWDPQRGYIVATVEHSGGIESKVSNLDAQVLLAALHTGAGVGAPELIKTVVRLVQDSSSAYPINRVTVTEIDGVRVPMGAAVGRYPEDVYDGVHTRGGNPWSLITSAVAEYHYRLALEFVFGNVGEAAVTGDLAGLTNHTNASHGSIVLQLLEAGDRYMARVARHTNADGTMHEQWDAHTGYGRGAIHLTWSYVAHMSASRYRQQLVSHINY
ncbi:hypothetical protein GGI25_006103 [Coemansia spiralis]|uniref:glucan 1,4-alpha-glucosidase n=2 Tax=Coemansia TaxID=4863 RepID=A0A9W8KVH6_9FUNG|nr:hypothetical protein EDC05_005375 [Coemansia umbellata]KAJ2669545.1 hypothetical protein GGI25_006103 [Coemansia spiralis]